MEVYMGLLISFCLLMYGVLKNIFIGYILVIIWALFVVITYRRGYALREIIKMSYNGGKQSFVVLKILILIGAVIGIWMASGTIPTIVYYCLKYITPHTFVLSAFLICCITSFLIGTSLGTVGTVGVPLMILARSGNINLNAAAGAIIAGAYFGDRCSPMSSSAALVANLTKTDIFVNIKNMIFSSITPFLLSVIFYFILSVSQPLKVVDNNLMGELLETFKIGFIMLLPVAIILVLSLCRVNIKISILFSILSASVLGIVYQNYEIKEILYYITFGFKTNSEGPLQNIIKGGGIISMLKASLVIFVSCALAGIFKEIKIFDRLKNTLLNMRLMRYKLFGITSIVSGVTAAFGCSQSIAVVMTNEIMKDCYNSRDNYDLALDLENSGILISALIPWNIAALVPTTTMGVSAGGYIPYAFYLYIVPIMYFVYSKYVNRIMKPYMGIQ